MDCAQTYWHRGEGERKLFLGAALFLLVMVMIAPQSRLFLEACLANAEDLINAWAPVSYFLVLLLLVAAFGSIYLLKSWPKSQEPENPMARYRREDPVDD